MNRMKLIAVIAIMPFIASKADDNKMGVRIHFDSFDQMAKVESVMTRLDEPLGLFGHFKTSAEDTAFLSRNGLEYEIFELHEPALPVAAELDSFYYTYDEMADSFLSWVAQYPSIAHYEIIGTSQQEFRNIYAFKISDNVGLDEDEPVALFDGAHHACEIMGMEICLALIDTLLTNYGQQPSITNLVDSTEIWVVPLINPDGNSAVHAGISLNYRKNGRDHDNDGVLYEYGCNDSWTCPTEGVDVNRNYDWYWQYSGSNIPMNYYYRGESPGSELENVAITSLVARIRPVVSITYHSWGEVIYYPWAWSNGSAAPDSQVIFNIALNIAQRIEREYGMGYYEPTASEGRGGLAENWQYGRYGVISFLPETVAAQDFIPESLERKNAVIANNLQGVFYLLGRAHGSQITGHVTDRRTGLPLQAEIKVLQNYSTLVSPRMSDSLYGTYHRLMTPGSYTVVAERAGYPARTFNNVVVQDGFPTVLDIRLGTLITGDANGSGVFNGLDVTYLVNYLKGTGPAPVPLEAADVNGDCLATGQDAIYMVNYFKGGALPIPCDN